MKLRFRKRDGGRGLGDVQFPCWRKVQDRHPLLRVAGSLGRTLACPALAGEHPARGGSGPGPRTATSRKLQSPGPALGNPRWSVGIFHRQGDAAELQPGEEGLVGDPWPCPLDAPAKLRQAPLTLSPPSRRVVVPLAQTRSQPQVVPSAAGTLITQEEARCTTSSHGGRGRTIEDNVFRHTRDDGRPGPWQHVWEAPDMARPLQRGRRPWAQPRSCAGCRPRAISESDARVGALCAGSPNPGSLVL